MDATNAIMRVLSTFERAQVGEVRRELGAFRLREERLVGRQVVGEGHGLVEGVVELHRSLRRDELGGGREHTFDVVLVGYVHAELHREVGGRFVDREARIADLAVGAELEAREGIVERAGSRPPVIFVTAKVASAELSRFVAAGALGVIEKPFDPMLLSHRVLELLAASAMP